MKRFSIMIEKWISEGVNAREGNWMGASAGNSGLSGLAASIPETSLFE